MIIVPEMLQPFDVLLFYKNPAWWDVAGWSCQLAIQQQQKNFLSGNSDYFPCHVEIFFDENHIYRAVPPVIIWEKFSDITERQDRFRVFRPRFYKFTSADSTEMINVFQSPVNYTQDGVPKSEAIIGSAYDTAQDIMIGLDSIFGHPLDPAFEFATGSQMVCSIGTALAFKHYLGLHPGSYDSLFSKIQPEAFKTALWRDEILRGYISGNSLHVLNIAPAYFANTMTHFNGEFNLMGGNF